MGDPLFTRRLVVLFSNAVNVCVYKLFLYWNVCGIQGVEKKQRRSMGTSVRKTLFCPGLSFFLFSQLSGLTAVR